MTPENWNIFVKKQTDLVKKYYENYYLTNIETLLNNGCTYEWLKPKDFQRFFTKSCDFNKFLLDNPYLNQYQNDKIKLAEDILENGTYFPIFARKEQDYTRIYQGNHRLYSLMIYDKKIHKIEKQFLFIYFPAPDIKVNIDWYDFNLQTLEIYKQNIVTNYKSIEKRLDHLGGRLSKYFFESDIKPLIEFNK